MFRSLFIASPYASNVQGPWLMCDGWVITYQQIWLDCGVCGKKMKKKRKKKKEEEEKEGGVIVITLSCSSAQRCRSEHR